MVAVRKGLAVCLACDCSDPSYPQKVALNPFVKISQGVIISPFLDPNVNKDKA